MSKNYEEIAHVFVPSSFGEFNGKKRTYRCSLGRSWWRRSDPSQHRLSCNVYVQFGTNPDYDEALKTGEIHKVPCHILDEDFEKVINSLNELHSNYKKSEPKV